MRTETYTDLLVADHIKRSEEISPMFKDRREAGDQLALLLARENIQKPVILPILRGGVPVAQPIAEKLGCAVHPLVTAKIPLFDKRYGIGAVNQGNILLNEELIEFLDLTVSDLYGLVNQGVKDLVKKQSEIYPSRGISSDLSGQTAVIVDDGIATGFTVLSTTEMVLDYNPKNIIIASPIAHNSALERLRDEGIKTYVINASEESGFMVDKFYRDFRDITDDEIIKALVSVS